MSLLANLKIHRWMFFYTLKEKGVGTILLPLVTCGDDQVVQLQVRDIAFAP